MIPSLRDEYAAPINPERESSRSVGYIQTVGDYETRLNGYVDGIEAVRQAIWHIFNTERYDNPRIHGVNYGSELRQFVGERVTYLEARADQVIRDALMQDDRIVDTRILDITQPDPRSAVIDVLVISVYGEFDERFEIPLVA